MTFKQIVDAVLAGAADASFRAQAKEMVNHRYQQLWGTESWAFKFATAPVGVNAGQQSLAFQPDDMGWVDSLQNQDGDPLTAFPDPRDFYAQYVNATAPEHGDPEAFTIVGGDVLLGPIPDVTRADYTLIYEKTVTLLDADGDVPAFPAGFHMVLVHGGKAELYAIRNIVAFQDQFEGLWNQALGVMRETLLTTVRDPGEVWSGRYRPEEW